MSPIMSRIILQIGTGVTLRENWRTIPRMEPEDKLKPMRNAQGHFLKGVSGNPTGRKSGVAAILTECYRNKLETVNLEDPERRTFGEMIADAVFQQALAGNIQAAAEIADRVEGKPRQSLGIHRDAEEFDVHGIIARITGRGGTSALDAGSSQASRSDTAKQ